MASSGQAFKGRWKILEWYADEKLGLPEWLVETEKDSGSADLYIGEDENGYTVQWTDKKGGTCTLSHSLTFLNGELVGVDSRVLITNDTTFDSTVVPRVGHLTGTNPPRLRVSLVGEIIEGDPGTFIAQGPPRPEDEG
jgi:hypothetical protein